VTRRALEISVALVCAIVAALLLAAPTRAAQPLPANTVLTILPVQPLALGRSELVVAGLATTSGQPVAYRRVQFYLDGAYEQLSWTNGAGRATLRLREDLIAGAHQIEAVFEGTPLYGPSRAAAQFMVELSEIRVQTIPKLVGLRFALDGRIFATDQDGVAQIPVERPGSYRLEVLPWDDRSRMQVEFSRWKDEVFTPYRDVRIPGALSFTAGFNVGYQVSFSFVDLAGQPIDPARIDGVTLKSSHGTVVTVSDMRPLWLQSRRVVRRLQRLEDSPIQYYIERVMVGDANLVNQGQQRFRVGPGDVWQIQLLMYSARFTARDALFRFPIGDGINLEYPDGRVEFLPFVANGELTVRSLVRGLYRVRVAGASGMAPISPIALSRDQDVQLLVVSYLDMAVVIVVAVGLALGFLFFGRPQLLRLLRNPRTSARRAAGYATRFAAPRALQKVFGQFELKLGLQGDSFGLARRRIDPIIVLAVSLIAIGTLGGFAGYRVNVTQARSAQLDLAPGTAAATAQQVIRATVVGNQQPESQAADEQPESQIAAQSDGDMAATATAVPATQASAPTAAPATQTPAPTAVPTAEPAPKPLGAPTFTPGTVSTTVLVFQRTLRFKSKGDDVVWLQIRLRELGYFGYAENTGYFGDATEQAVMRFQHDSGRPETGEVDAATVAALNRAVQVKP